MIQIYHPSNTDYEHNGDCVLWPSRCEITAELNGAWVLQLEHPIDDDGRWQYIIQNAVLKVPTWMATKYQRYRIRVVEKTETTVTATAYPVFYDCRDDAYIFDIRITNKTAPQALTLLFAAAPSKYTASSNMGTNESEVFKNCNLLEALTGPFLDRWGGEILYNNNEIIVNNRIGGDYGVTVEYGKNITGTTYNIDMTDVATRLIPYAYNGRQMSGLTPWVDSPIINSYPKVFIRTVQFDDVKLAEDASDDDATDDSITICETQTALDAKLRELCNAMYAEGKDKPKISMSIDMLALENTDEYAGFSGLEEIGLGDTVHCKHSKLGIVSDAKVVGIVWDCARDRIASVTLGDFAYDYLKDNGISDIMTSLQEMAQNFNSDGSIMAERIKGLLNGMNVQLNAQYTAAKKQDVMAILFENLDPESPLYGALGIGTQGLQISKTRTADGKGWEWTTAATANGIVADTVVTGTLSDKAGKNYWDLDSGDMSIIANTFKLVAGGSAKTIQELIAESTSENLLIDPIGLSTDYWTIEGTLTRGQTDPLGGTDAVMLEPTAGGEGYIQARKDTNTPFDTMGSRYKLTVWLKASIDTLADNKPIKLYLNRVGSVDIFPTMSWQQFSMELDVNSIDIGDIVTIGGWYSFTPSDGFDLYVYNPCVTKVLTDQEIFDKMSAYGQQQGIWVTENGKLYINMQYLRSGTAKFGGLSNGKGSVEVYDDSDNLMGKIDNNGIRVSSEQNQFANTYLQINRDGLLGYKSGKLFSDLIVANSVGVYTELNARGDSLGIQINYVSNAGQTDQIALFGKNAITFSKPYGSGSDRRLKSNIERLESDIINDLIPVSFNWKDSGDHAYGFIAQDVQEICPELVQKNDNGILSLSYTGIIPHLVHKVQQQQKQINDLEARLSALEKEVRK